MGTRNDGGEGFGLAVIEVERRGGEILLCSRLHAKDTIAQFDDVEIDLENALLAPKEFDKYGEVCFKELARVGARRCAENILGSLLGDGAATCHNTSVTLVAVERIQHILIRETTVLVKTGVFAVNDGTDHVGRDVLDGHPVVLEREPFALVERIQLAQEHQRRQAHRSKAIEHYHRYAQCKKDCCAQSTKSTNTPLHVACGDPVIEAPCHGRQSMCRSGY